MCVLVSRPIEIITFLLENGETLKWVVDFSLGKKTYFEKTWKTSRISSKKLQQTMEIVEDFAGKASEISHFSFLLFTFLLVLFLCFSFFHFFSSSFFLFFLFFCRPSRRHNGNKWSRNSYCKNDDFFNFSLLALVSEFNCFLRSRCSMEMWCPDDRGRDSWDWVGPPAWERACFNSPECGESSSPVKTEPLQIGLLLLVVSCSFIFFHSLFIFCHFRSFFHALSFSFIFSLFSLFFLLVLLLFSGAQNLFFCLDCLTLSY